MRADTRLQSGHFEAHVAFQRRMTLQFHFYFTLADQLPRNPLRPIAISNAERIAHHTDAANANHMVQKLLSNICQRLSVTFGIAEARVAGNNRFGCSALYVKYCARSVDRMTVSTIATTDVAGDKKCRISMPSPFDYGALVEVVVLHGGRAVQLGQWARCCP